MIEEFEKRKSSHHKANKEDGGTPKKVDSKPAKK
jgi:hypothetical protein